MLWNVVFLLAIVFVLTYDPNSRTLEKFVGQPTAPPRNHVKMRITKPSNLPRAHMIVPTPVRTQMGAVM